MKKTKWIVFFSVIVLLIVGASFSIGIKKSDKFKIYFDEKLIAGKNEYLADSVRGLSKMKRPNVILILADDLGQTDISLYGNKIVSTPNIDGIGRRGATFTEGYISSPVCSPSRAGLITGRYQQRFGHEFQPNNRYLNNVFEYIGFKIMPRFRPVTPIKTKYVPETEERMRQGLPPSEITMAEMLKKYGYTNALIGKWHLGAADFAIPCNRGFDYQYGFYEAFTLYTPTKNDTDDIVDVPAKRDFMDHHQWKTAEGREGNCAILRNCCERQEESKYLTDKLTDEAIAFVDRSKDQPFFLYLPYNAPHAPLQVPKQYYEQFGHIKDPVKRVYAAMIKKLDDEVGRLLSHVDSLGLGENTIIVFLSDNGGAVYNGTTDNAPYRGGKLTNFEGGLRVPFMMEWKGKIKPGTVYSNPVISLDVFSTIAAAIGIELPQDRKYDGVDLIPYVNGDSTGVPHQVLFWRSDFNVAVREGEWKYVSNAYNGEKVLYNMREDSVERKNLYYLKPDVVKHLTDDLAVWETEMVKPLWPRVVNYVYKDDEGKHVFAF
ncbi:MAG: sulfatase-like hydrolase/transferase [Bacteroidetes bacterium]|nr:sulfatase-like hydrolase/transferase [Bacteroidota bacterium]